MNSLSEEIDDLIGGEAVEEPLPVPDPEPVPEPEPCPQVPAAGAADGLRSALRRPDARNRTAA